MTNAATLDDIALGEATPAQARAALGKALAERSPEAAQQVYTALRSWVWKALTGRRRDPELREWFDILRRIGAYLAHDHRSQAERLQALHELIYESISVSEVLSVSEMLKRRHVRKVLAMLRAARDGRLDRAEIGKRLELKQGNLTRILNLMASSGLIEREKYGKQAIFQLTRSGHDEAQKLGYPLIEPIEQLRIAFPHLRSYELAIEGGSGTRIAAHKDKPPLGLKLELTPTNPSVDPPKPVEAFAQPGKPARSFSPPRPETMKLRTITYSSDFKNVENVASAKQIQMEMAGA